jgi:hypothetical protein
MNYPYPIPSQQANLVALVAGSTRELGYYDKRIDEIVAFTVDYSQVVPAVTVAHYSFRVTPGGMPELMVSKTGLTGSPSTGLAFTLSGGIGGILYNVTVDMTLASNERRSDTLNVNVIDPNEGCGCGVPQIMVPSLAPINGTGVVAVNPAPRYFVSAIAPVGATVMDRWYNSQTAVVSEFVTDGTTTWWAPL